MKSIVFCTLLTVLATSSTADGKTMQDWVDIVYENPRYPIEYETVAEALDDLMSKQPSTQANSDGQIQFGEEFEHYLSIWTFVSSDHPAYPALIKHNAYMSNGIPMKEIDVLCSNPNQACQDLEEGAKQELLEHYSKFQQ